MRTELEKFSPDKMQFIEILLQLKKSSDYNLKIHNFKRVA
jgi:hypothetical protein